MNLSQLHQHKMANSYWKIHNNDFCVVWFLEITNFLCRDFLVLSTSSTYYILKIMK